MTDIRTKVNAIIRENLAVDEAEITRDAKSHEDLGADSLDIAEIIMEFEKEFKITITDEDTNGTIDTLTEPYHLIVRNKEVSDTLK